MSEIPVLEIAGGGAFALLVIKEFRMWGKQVLEMRTAKRNGNGSSKVPLGERVASNETEIVNIKEVFKEQRTDNKREHNEIKTLIKTEIKTLKSK